MRRHVQKPQLPVHHRPRPGELGALRHDLVFAVGVVADALRGRPFTS